MGALMKQQIPDRTGWNDGKKWDRRRSRLTIIASPSGLERDRRPQIL
ncbi:MAG: hypothetical protein ACP5D7_20455 [Limnospira sp.]